jgi:CBS domain containing-hemolysin-like protein
VVHAWEWVSLLVGLLLAAFFASAETALTALGEARVQHLVESAGWRGARLRVWQKHPERILSTLLLGSTLVNVGLGSLTAIMAHDFGLDSTIAIITGLTTMVLLIVGEITPKTFAKRYSSGTALALMPLVNLFYWVLYPISSLLVQIPRGLSRAVGIGAPTAESVTSQELEYLIEQGARHGSLDETKEQLLSSVLAFTEVLVKEIMIPRTQVVALEESASYDDVMRAVEETELSRIPVYRGTMDEVVGVLYVKTLLADVRKGIDPAHFQLAKYLRKPFFVPEVMKVSKLLNEMQRRKTHLAVVVDEFGGTSGIVTLEDVVEEIVGDIHDESDIEEKRVKVLSDGVVVADASVPLRELEEHLNVEFPEGGDYETLGGFLTATAGRVPPPGSLVVWGGLTFTVKQADDRRVLKVEIARTPESKPALPVNPPPEKVH